jgi:hypothetical protein
MPSVGWGVWGVVTGDGRVVGAFPVATAAAGIEDAVPFLKIIADSTLSDTAPVFSAITSSAVRE